MKALCKLLPVFLLLLTVTVSSAQPERNIPGTEKVRPYKLLNSGRQITIRSTKNLKHVLLWTTGGNRVVEYKEINHNNLVLDIPLNQKTYFLMIAMIDGKVYTEKIGIR